MKKLAAALLLVPATMLVVGCSKPPEQQFLTQYFRAAKARDNTTVGRMAAVVVDPRTQGSVEDFAITSIGQETRTPLTFAPLLEAEAMQTLRQRGWQPDYLTVRRRTDLQAPQAGDALVVIESMKMEIPVITEDGGTVKEMPFRISRSGR